MIGGRLLAERADDPRARRIGVGLRLLRRKGLRADDDQRLRRIDAADQILELRAIHVGDEMRRDVAAPLRLERIAHQQRSQIRAADADVDHVLESLAGHAALLARAHRADEARQLLPRVAALPPGLPPNPQTPNASAVCSTARCSVLLIGSPRNIAVMRAGRSAARARSSSSDKLFCVMRWREKSSSHSPCSR